MVMDGPKAKAVIRMSQLPMYPLPGGVDTTQWSCTFSASVCCLVRATLLHKDPSACRWTYKSRDAEEIP